MHRYLSIKPVRKRPTSAFTLIELLAVVAVIVILTGITFGVSKGVLNNQARAQARAELSMIAQALEAFKLMYGDYPVVAESDGTGDDGIRGLEYSNSRKLSRALRGLSFLEYDNTAGEAQMTDLAAGNERKSFLDDQFVNYIDEAGDDKLLVDPWRQAYIYIYNKNAAAWDNVGYVLFSKGPDRVFDLDSLVSTGIIDPTTTNNIDNIYPNQ